MGNALEKKYDIPKAHNATAGLCQLFKIYHGTSKETNKEVSVWNLSKDDLAKRKPAITDKAILEQLYTIMRKDLASMKDYDADTIGIVKILEVNATFFFFNLVSFFAHVSLAVF